MLRKPQEAAWVLKNINGALTLEPVKPQETPRNEKAENVQEYIRNDLSVEVSKKKARQNAEESYMNKKQRILLFVAVGLIVLAGLFPPCMINAPRGDIGIGHVFLFRSSVGSVDLKRLFIEWILIAVVTGALWMAFRKKE